MPLAREATISITKPHQRTDQDFEERRITVVNERRTFIFTQEYSQPEDYHFCLEPVIAAECIGELCAQRSAIQLADVGAGCGVFGLELCYQLGRKIKSLGTFEIQNEFAHHLAENSRRYMQVSNIQIKSWMGDIREQHQAHRGQFDLVVANLPFFDPGEGRLSPSSLRNNCRFFLNGRLHELVFAISEILSENGEAYILGRERAFAEVKEIELEPVAQIRQSVLMRLRRVAKS